MRKDRQLLRAVLAVTLVVAVLGIGGCGGQQTAEQPTGGQEPAAPEMKLVKDGVLTVGSDLDYPPFESLAGDTPEGFDVDLVNEIAKELGLQVEWKKEIFDTLIPTLKAGGKFDMIASAMTINAEREEEIDFTDPYFDSNQSITMKAGATYTGPEDLKGKKVGVQAGTTGDQWAQENLKPAGAEIVTFKDTTGAISALSAGNVDAVVIDLPVAAEIAKDKTRGLAVVAQVPTGEQYGFGISKDNPGLKDAVNKALAKIREDGRYDRIYTKWFGDVPR